MQSIEYRSKFRFISTLKHVYGLFGVTTQSDRALTPAEKLNLKQENVKVAYYL